MYAIAADMDVTELQEDCVENAFREYGFDRQQHVYFGNEEVDAVSCVLAVQDVAQRFPWFGACVWSIRMLRIEEASDLSVAIEVPVGAVV